MIAYSLRKVGPQAAQCFIQFLSVCYHLPQRPELSMLYNMVTPYSVKAKGILRVPPLPDVTICDLKLFILQWLILPGSQEEISQYAIIYGRRRFFLRFLRM